MTYNMLECRGRLDSVHIGDVKGVREVRSEGRGRDYLTLKCVKLLFKWIRKKKCFTKRNIFSLILVSPGLNALE